MNAFVIVASTLLVLTLDLWLVRVNRYFLGAANHARKLAQPDSSLWETANTAARWLGLIGGGLSSPLLALLAVNSNGGSWDWVLTIGLPGMVLIAAGAVLAVVVFVARCISRPDDTTYLVRFLYQKARHTIQKRVIPTRQILLGAVAVGVGIVLMPLILEIIKFIAYAAGLLLAGRLGLLDNGKEKQREDGFYYNYNTGEMDDGCDPLGIYPYDFHEDEYS